MITQYVQGDLLKAFRENKFGAIVHGCNCFHTMGAGIARAIAEQFPHAYDQDKKTVCGLDKRGGYSVAKTSFGYIINGYTQFQPGSAHPEFLYASIRNLFLKLDVLLNGQTVGIPKIGAGIAGGSWDTIAKIIDAVTPNLNIIVYQLDPLPEGKRLKPIHPLIGVMARHITDDKNLDLFQGIPITEIIPAPPGSSELWVKCSNTQVHRGPKPVSQLLFAWADNDEDETQWLPIEKFASRL